ncbi:phosphotransferase [Streptomyces sp. NPDC086549]|uniref:phosphotransferase n=1 Tax=Streptomyces sp. NPDC086549 TaxID=3365752 RepID=UPI0038076FB0
MSGFVPRWEYADHPDALGSPRKAWIPAEFGVDGRFVTRDVLARAGQGYIVLAEDRWSGGDVVLKGMWWPETALDDPRQVQNTLSEQRRQRQQGLRAVRQATQLTQQCPVVISVEFQPSPSLIAAGRHPDPPHEDFLVQQFIGQRGGTPLTLKHEIQARKDASRRYTEDELLDLAEQLCNTLAALHAERHTGKTSSKGWIHADIKPENILVLGPPARYVLIDYDAAVPVGGRISTTTPAYAPPGPEGSDDPGEMSEASVRFDIYMLGATLAHAAALDRLTEQQYRQLYADEFEASAPARKYLTSLDYGPVLTNALTTCLSSRKFRLATVDRVRIDLARARDATVLQSALRGLGEAS